MRETSKEKLVKITLAQGLCRKELIQDIDKAFNTKPKEYFEAFMENNEEYLYFSMVPSESYPYFEKVVGIIEYSVKNNQYVQLYSLIKKAEPQLFKILKNNTKIPPNKLFNILMKTESNEVAQETALAIILFMMESELQNAKRKLFLPLEFLEVINKQFEIYGHRRYNAANTFNNPYFRIFEKTKQLHETLIDVKKTKNIATSLSLFMRKNFEEFEIKQNGFGNAMDIDERYKQRAMHLRSGGPDSLFSALQKFLTSYGYFENFLDKDIDENDVDNLNDLFVTFKNEYNYSLDDEHTFVISMIILSLLKEFRTLRPLVQRTDNYIDFENAKVLKELNKEVENLKSIINNSKTQKNLEVLQLKEALKQANEESFAKDKKILLLEKELEKYEVKEKEQAALLELVVADTDETEGLDENYNIEEFKAEINSKRIMVIGGHDNWILKMKDFLPDATFYDVEKTLNSPLSNVDSMDIVIFNILKNKHAAYDKVKQRLSDKNKMIYVDHTSIKPTIIKILKHTKYK